MCLQPLSCSLEPGACRDYIAAWRLERIGLEPCALILEPGAVRLELELEPGSLSLEPGALRLDLAPSTRICVRPTGNSFRFVSCVRARGGL